MKNKSYVRNKLLSNLSNKTCLTKQNLKFNVFLKKFCRMFHNILIQVI